MTQAVAADEKRPQYFLWMALRIVRMARRNNNLANIARKHFIAALKEMCAQAGEPYFKKRSGAGRNRESAMWLAAELHRMAKQEMPEN
jgi:hypothetical protein